MKLFAISLPLSKELERLVSTALDVITPVIKLVSCVDESTTKHLDQFPTALSGKILFCFNLEYS